MAQVNTFELVREEAAQQFMSMFTGEFVAAGERRITELKARGRWNLFEQARFDGLVELMDELENCSIGFLAIVAHQHGFHIDFAFVDPETGIKFADVGPILPEE